MWGPLQFKLHFLLNDNTDKYERIYNHIPGDDQKRIFEQLTPRVDA